MSKSDAERRSKGERNWRQVHSGVSAFDAFTIHIHTLDKARKKCAASKADKCGLMVADG
jgi:hypothetical protein